MCLLVAKTLHQITNEQRICRMKTLTRIVLLGGIVCLIYFSTIGTKDFYRLLAMINEVFETIGNNYLKK
jgi:lipid-A-disaccharide synthase-like uncharacterized protein